MNILKSMLFLFLAGTSAASLAAEAEDTPPAPQIFVERATLDAMAEVELGKIALAKSEDPEVRRFAQRMVDEHGNSNQALASLAKSKAIEPPTRLDREHRTMIANIDRESGVAFDRAYLEHMVVDHTKTIALFESATKMADPELARFAKEKLPVLKEHKQAAQKLTN